MIGSTREIPLLPYKLSRLEGCVLLLRALTPDHIRAFGDSVRNILMGVSSVSFFLYLSFRWFVVIALFGVTLIYVQAICRSNRPGKGRRAKC